VSQQSINDGKELGIAAAQAILKNREGDGFNDDTDYTPGHQPGDWRPTGSGPAVTPNWGKVKAFSPTLIKNFRPTRPAGFSTRKDLLASVEYAAQVNEVKRLGAANSGLVLLTLLNGLKNKPILLFSGQMILMEHLSHLGNYILLLRLSLN
jgi:hypothetical protein